MLVCKMLETGNAHPVPGDLSGLVATRLHRRRTHGPQPRARRPQRVIEQLLKDRAIPGPQQQRALAGLLLRQTLSKNACMPSKTP
ncbi:MAG TPA: hypothetical protein VLT92_06910 [Burkholderiales bacterium]|nr:hypothetical protein [Burkholderiales bacterium]